MALAFPDAPVTGDTYTPQDGNTYRYDGVKWIFATTSPLEPASLKQNNTGIDITDTGANGNAVILADGTTVGYFNSSGLTVYDSLFTLMDPTDHTRKANFDLSSITSGTTRTVVFPNASGEILVNTASQSLANQTFNNTTTITIKDANLTLQDNTITTKQLNFQLSGITTGTTRTLTVPNSDGIIVLTDNVTGQGIDNKNFDISTIMSVSDGAFDLSQAADGSARGRFSLSLLTAKNTTTTYKLPAANTSIVGTDVKQTLTLKTLNNTTFTGTTVVGDAAVDKPKLVNHSVQTESLGTLNGTGTTNVNIANATYFTVTMTANARTFAFTDLPPSGHAATFFMEITNGGLATITWPSSVRWTIPNVAADYPNGTPPLLTASGIDLVAFTTSDAGSTYRGSFVMKDSK